MIITGEKITFVEKGTLYVGVIQNIKENKVEIQTERFGSFTVSSDQVIQSISRVAFEALENKFFEKH